MAALVYANEDGYEFYNLTHPVFPNSAGNSRTDVMLVQYLIKEFLGSELAPAALRTAFTDILLAATSRGQRFDDGIYGLHTRDAVKLFEQHFRSPGQDGIVRPVPDMEIFASAPSVYKLKNLNFAFSSKMLFRRMVMQEYAKRSMNPPLYKELYSG